MQKNLVGRVAKLEKEVSDLVVYYEQHDRAQQSSNPKNGIITSNSHNKSANINVHNGAQYANNRKPRLRSKSRTRYKQNHSEIIFETDKRNIGNVEICGNEKMINHPEGFGKSVDLKRKLAEEMQKSEEAYRIIDGLKEELSYSKARMSTMAKDVQILMEALEAMRNKYKTIKLFRKEKMAQIEELKKINIDLCRALDQEMKKHAETVATLKQDSHSKLSLKSHQQISEVLNRTKEQYDKLQEIHEKLKQTCQELQEKYEDANQEIDKLKSELNNQAKLLQEKNEEMDNLKILLDNEKNKNACICDAVDKLEQKVKDMLIKESKASKEIQSLKSKIYELEELKQQYQKEYMDRENDFKQMECECEVMRKELADMSTRDITKCKKIEKEVEKLRLHMKEKENKIIEERDHLKTLVDELSEVVQKHKHRIKDLVSINRQQETVLKNQVVMMQNKEHHLKMAEVEVEAARKRAYILEEQIDKLRHSMQSYEKFQLKKKCDCKTKLQTLQDELQNARKALNAEQEKLSIKEKIIEDQADTIKKLKNNIENKGDATKQHNTKITDLQNQLEQERANKKELISNIEEIKWHKEQLKRRILKLEKALTEKFRSEISEKSKDQDKLLQGLELQVALKQREWELRCKLLNTEKRRAVQAAKFATKKLVDTVNDFQYHTENHKKMQALIVRLIENKTNTRLKKGSNYKKIKKQCNYNSNVIQEWNPEKIK